MVKTPKIISSKSIFKNNFQEIKFDIIELNGYRWEQVYFTKPNKNGACILPVDEKGIYLVYQYRHANKAFFWQIPMGMMDIGYNPLETAKKELVEETGFIAERFVLMGSMFAEPGMSNQETFMFVATGLTKGKQKIEETEIGMKVKHFDWNEIKKMIKNGKIKCGFTLSALELYQNNYL